MKNVKDILKYDCRCNPPAPVIDVSIGIPNKHGIKEKIKGKIDTGASISVIPYECIKKLGLVPQSDKNISIAPYEQGHLFSLSQNYKKYLKHKRSVDEELREKFKDNNYPLGTRTIILKISEGYWIIVDIDNDKKKYMVKYDGIRLQIYDRDNVKNKKCYYVDVSFLNGLYTDNCLKVIAANRGNMLIGRDILKHICLCLRGKTNTFNVNKNFCEYFHSTCIPNRICKDVDNLTKKAKDKDSDLVIRQIATYLIQEIGKKEPDKVIPILENLIRDENPCIQRSVGYAFIEVGKENFDPVKNVLDKLSEDANPTVKEIAKYTLNFF